MLNITDFSGYGSGINIFPSPETQRLLDLSDPVWIDLEIQLDELDDELLITLTEDSEPLYEEADKLSPHLGKVNFYCERGIAIFPANSKYSFQDATTDFKRLLEMWIEYPNSPPAIATGCRFGLIAIRFDVFLRVMDEAYNLTLPCCSPIALQEYQTWEMKRRSPMWIERGDYIDSTMALLERAIKENKTAIAEKLHFEMDAKVAEYGEDEELLFFRIEKRDDLTLPSFDGLYGDNHYVIDDGDWIHSNNPLENENNPPKKLPDQMFNYLMVDSSNNKNQLVKVTSNPPEVFYEENYFPISQNEIEHHSSSEIEGKNRSKAKDKLTKLLKLKVPIESVIKRGSSNSIYELKLEDGRFVVLGSAYELRQQKKVAAKLFEAKVNLPTLSSDRWQRVLDLILYAEEEIETLTEAEELRGYVLAFFSFDGWRMDYWDNRYSIDFTIEDKEQLVNNLRHTSARGFYDRNTGEAYLPLGTFLQFLNVRSGKRWTQREITTILSRYNFSYRQKSIRYKSESGKTKTYNSGRFWISPIGYLKPQ